LHSNYFEVGLFRPSASREKGSHPEMILRTWDADSTLKSLSWLRYENGAGRNIYIRPAGEHQMSLVDDLSAPNIERMRQTGFQPAAVVETSPGNFQAWLNHGRALPKEVGTSAARFLAHEFGGDIKAADWRHFGRLAGFTNRKEKHQQSSGLFPYVRLIEAKGKAYSKAETFLSVVQDRLHREQDIRQARLSAMKARGVDRGSLKSIDHFRQDSIYQGDGTRSDLAYALYAMSYGISESDIRVELHSRDLSHKGSERRQEAYIERTLRKAMSVRGLSR
jgi:hypothetical protein